MIAGATSYCPERVPNHEIKMSVDKIKQKMMSLRNQIARMQEEYFRHRYCTNSSAGITEEQARQKFFEIQGQYKDATHEMNSLKNLNHVHPIKRSGSPLDIVEFVCYASSRVWTIPQGYHYQSEDVLYSFIRTTGVPR